MNRRHAVMTLLVITLVAGPFLFIVPSVYSAKPDIDPVIIRIDGSLNYYSTPPGGLLDGIAWNDFFNITLLEDVSFDDPSWTKVGDIYEITPWDDPPYDVILDSYLNDGNPHDVEILLLIANKYKNKLDGLYIVQYEQFCDFDGDGEVTGHDTRLISTHMNNPGTYVWKYDLDQDGDIDTDDIHIADSYKGTYEQWITLPIPPTRLVIIDSKPYLIAELWHFSRIGIRH